MNPATPRWFTFWSDENDDKGMPKTFAAYHVVPVRDCPGPSYNTFIVQPITDDARRTPPSAFPGSLDHGWHKIAEMLGAAHSSLKSRVTYGDGA